MSEKAAPERKPRPPLWWRLVATAIVLGVFGWGAVLLGDFLRVRKEVNESVQRRMDLSRPPPDLPFVSADDPLLRTWMARSVPWQHVRELPFGDDRAWFVTGTSENPPKEVFRDVLATLQPEKPIEEREPDELMDLSASGLLRKHISVGQYHGVAFLARMPPDLEAAAEGRFAFEPGGTMLAFQRHETSWEYVTWTFPDGLNLSAFMGTFGAPKGVLERMALGVEKHLEPALALGGDPAPTSSAEALPFGTVYCRARGTAGQALEGASDAFTRAGWHEVKASTSPAGEEIRVLADAAGGRNVWLVTTQREREGGFVTVMVGTP